MAEIIAHAVKKNQLNHIEVAGIIIIQLWFLSIISRLTF